MEGGHLDGVEDAEGDFPASVGRRAWWRSGWILAGVPLLAVLVIAAVVRLPYQLISPGLATPAAELVHIQGQKVYQPAKPLLFTTVSESAKVNGYELLAGWLDSDVEIVKQEDLTGGLPAERVRQFNQDLMDESKIGATRAALERLGYPVSVKGSGALVMQVQAGMPADGILKPGDVIRLIDGRTIRMAAEAVDVVRAHRPGDQIEIDLSRGGKDRRVEIRANAGSGGRAVIGAVLATKDLKFDFPFKVEIATGNIGGPSAGLAFTMTLIDLLTPGNLTGDHRVAVTGQINSDGTVGIVDGVEQKAVAARQAGADTFIVPVGRVAQARTHAGRMKVIGVRTLDDALAAVKGLGGSPLPPR